MRSLALKDREKGPLSELLSPGRPIDTYFPRLVVVRRADDEEACSVLPFVRCPRILPFRVHPKEVTSLGDVFVRGGKCSCRRPRRFSPPLIKQSSQPRDVCIRRRRRRWHRRDGWKPIDNRASIDYAPIVKPCVVIGVREHR